MDSQTLLLVDTKDKFLGYANRRACHTGRGKRHRAFVTVVIDSENRVLLHKRKHRLFDGLWDLTAISHPLHLGDKRDESYQEASDRALAKEMGIGHVAIEKIGAFNYFARDGKSCENEYCAILTGKYDGKFRPNKQEVYEAKKVKFDEFMADISKNPKKYTPWARLAVRQLQSKVPPKGRAGDVESKSLLQDELESFLKIFEPYQQSYFAKRIKETGHFSPLVAKFYKDLDDFSQGGKKMRGFLVWMGYRVGIGGSTLPTSLEGTTLNSVLPVCLAYEIAHNFLLIHDDIIDRSDMRRGKLTMHKRYEKFFGEHYGGSQAILIGDVAFVEALRLVNGAGFGDRVKNKCFAQLLAILLDTAWGQALDVEYAFRQATFGQIWKMVVLKAAKYSVIGPLLVGAGLGTVKKSQLAAVGDYGLNVGVAFQIQDDILGVFGDEAVLGKSTLSDMREGKNTILIYKTRELANREGKKVIGRLWGKRDGDRRDIRVVGEIIEKSGALEWCQAKNRRLVGLAKKDIARITNDRHLGQIFEEIADFVVGRTN